MWKSEGFKYEVEMFWERIKLIKQLNLVPKAGIEPVTYALRVRCSANWAISAW